MGTLSASDFIKCGLHLRIKQVFQAVEKDDDGRKFSENGKMTF